MVQQLRGYRLVDPGTGGDKGVHVVHALDVAGGEAFARLPTGSFHVCGGNKPGRVIEESQPSLMAQKSVHSVLVQGSTESHGGLFYTLLSLSYKQLFPCEIRWHFFFYIFVMQR